MFNPGNPFDSFLVIPILNALVAVYKLILFFKLPGAFGLALIVLTALIRVALNPLMVTQLKSAHKLSKLKPELDRLSEKHKDDKNRLHQEQLKLYQEAGINPAAGCLPLLIQMPILLGLYNLFFKLLSNTNLVQVTKEINSVLYTPFLKISTINLSFFGMDLAHKPSDWSKYGIWLLLVPVVTALLQYLQTRMMTPKTPQTALKKVEDEKNKEKKEDMGTAMQKQMAIMMPLMIGFFSYSFPLGLSIYWNTFTIFGIIQQRQLNKIMEKENEEKR
ncbi:YidC/Oxa1 family membrane protein insertase [Patescibacteria group bacterium]|nr:YidC/Oxa1 family membrane protein insertase [Patescibacteria group bacterium]MCL5797182.1 YidC/Oxa1 family membrane protein insertase [Patescibacteria group bacterium]